MLIMWAEVALNFCCSKSRPEMKAKLKSSSQKKFLSKKVSLKSTYKSATGAHSVRPDKGMTYKQVETLPGKA